LITATYTPLKKRGARGDLRRGRVPYVRRLTTSRTGENLPSPLFVKEGNLVHLDGRLCGNDDISKKNWPYPSLAYALFI